MANPQKNAENDHVTAQPCLEPVQGVDQSDFLVRKHQDFRVVRCIRFFEPTGPDRQVAQLHDDSTYDCKYAEDRKADAAAFGIDLATGLARLAVKTPTKGATEQNFIADVLIIVVSVVITVDSSMHLSSVMGVIVLREASLLSDASDKLLLVSFRLAVHHLSVVIDLCQGQIAEKEREEGHPRL